MEVNSKKIMVILLPYWGHLNPTFGMVNELIKRGHHVIYYGNSECQQAIEKTGATYKEYTYFTNIDTQSTTAGNVPSFVNLIKHMLEVTDRCLPSLISDVHNEKPDLIIYDTLSLHTKYLFLKLRTDYERNPSTSIKPPLGAIFCQSFVPTSTGPSSNQNDERYKFLVDRQNEINSKYKIEMPNVFRVMFDKPEKLKIVSVFPELQPNVESLDNSFKFAGCCLSEVRKQEITNPKLKEIIDKFNPVNPLDSSNDAKKNTNILIYVSLGTLFNSNITVFEKIIEAIRIFKKEDDINGAKTHIIISVGPNNLQTFENKINNENYQLPNDTLLLATAPQIEILQRASLYVTHCGMNSASESIDYGVPMICMPINADQPMVAKRLVDDLNLGVKFDYSTLKPEELSNSIKIMLNDSSYHQRVINLSKISRKYNGAKNSADFICNSLSWLQLRDTLTQSS